MAKIFSKDDVAAHKSKDDLYIIVDDDVYNLTEFQSEHPGGQKSKLLPDVCQEKACTHTKFLTVLQRVAGKDASKQFWKYHNEGILKKYKGQLQVGSLDSKKQATPPTPPPSPPTEQKLGANVKAEAEPGTAVPVPAKEKIEPQESMDPFGDIIPYADPSWYQSVSVETLDLASWTLADSISVPFSVLQRISCCFTRRSPRVG